MSGAASLANQFGGLANLAGVNLRRGGLGQEAQGVLKSRLLVEEFIKRNDLLTELSSIVGDPPTLWLAVKRFRETVLTIREDESEGSTTIAIDWTDPAFAASWANALVALANELIRTRARDEASRNIEYLNEQLERTSIVELDNAIYNLIENEMKILMLADVRTEYAFTVVDPAVSPEIRRSPRRKLIVLSGGVLGLFVGTIVAFAYNLFRRLRSNE